jgi:hypothetical protein
MDHMSFMVVPALTPAYDSVKGQILAANWSGAEMGAERSENKWSGSGAVSGIAKNLRSGSGAKRGKSGSGAESGIRKIAWSAERHFFPLQRSASDIDVGLSLRGFYISHLSYCLVLWRLKPQ